MNEDSEKSTLLLVVDGKPQGSKVIFTWQSASVVIYVHINSNIISECTLDDGYVSRPTTALNGTSYMDSSSARD